MKVIHTPGQPLRFEPEPPGIDTSLTTLSDSVSEESMLETKDIKQSRPSILFMVDEFHKVRRVRVIRVDSDVLVSWRLVGGHGWTQFKTKPYRAKLFKTQQEAHAFVAPGPRVKVWLVPWHGTTITEAEKAPDGSTWVNGERHRQSGEAFPTKAKAKSYALKQLKRMADDEASTLKKTRARIREMEKL